MLFAISDDSLDVYFFDSGININGLKCGCNFIRLDWIKLKLEYFSSVFYFLEGIKGIEYRKPVKST